MTTTFADSTGRNGAAYWSSRSCSGEAPRGERLAAEVPEPGSSVLVGPPGSGKTSFLTSLARAFESPSAAEWTRFVPGRNLTALMNGAVAAIDRKAQAPASSSISEGTYTFQIGMRVAEHGNASDAIEEMEVSVLAPPGIFFDVLAGEGMHEIDPDRLEDLVRAARNARCLVLCVDSSGGGTDRKLRLAGVISRLLGTGPRRLLRMGAKPWPARESPWERAPRLELPFERVLVLLSKIEIFCSEAERRLAELEGDWLSASPAELRSIEKFGGLGARGIAEMLDLRALAEERIDGLDLLASSLKPDAKLAVCGISTAGFYWSPPNDRSRLASSAPGSNLTFGPGEPSPVPRLTPFGIWPALLFMTTGRVVPPLATLDPRRAIAPQAWLQLSEATGGRR